jgi:hypothetical protein
MVAMMLLRQRSALSGFSYDAFDAQASRVGEVLWPTVAQARNARLKWHGVDATAGEIQLRHLGQRARVGWEYTRRGFTNDVRFLLDSDKGRLAEAEVIFPPDSGKRHEVYLRLPFEGRLQRANTWLRTRYQLFEGEQLLGVVQEPRAFTVKRELVVDVPPRFDGLMQLFFFFLVHNSAYG